MAEKATYEEAGNVERRRSSVADINLNKNLDAKYAANASTLVPSCLILTGSL